MAGKGKGFRIIANIVLIFLTICTLLPFILLISASISSETAITRFGYSFIPKEIDFAAFRYLWIAKDKILKAYGMTFFVTIVGTTMNLFMTMFVGYLLSKKDLPGRSFLSFVLFFTMLFSGGMIPSYLIWSQLIGVSDSVFGLILPSLMMSAFNVILMRTYFSVNVPQEILEAAEMDSCSQVGMLFHICIPLAKPMIATISLFAALGYWNDWINAMYYLNRRKDLYTIQAMLNGMQNNLQFLKNNAELSVSEFAQGMPTQSVRMAIAVVAILPILIVYPFFQRSFVRGIVIGGVKG